MNNNRCIIVREVFFFKARTCAENVHLPHFMQDLMHQTTIYRLGEGKVTYIIHTNAVFKS